ncbi:hypothetical protein PA25_17990 [Pseudoalteromonas sp. A25]|uniref:hypothetical protein n=1 Tax=Pseudoalteromonas sp. A25 TaxID=116092 RepID=UPI00126084EC|nr:hypothetical protein [Pseudoalteromonas sp. A25]BBN81814.1 hypothetical protein PA25_17990 [Pseudoalteromonas sp. A25]
MKRTLAMSVSLSLLSPIFVGASLGLYFAVSSQGSVLAIFFSMLSTALANAHVVGLSMALLVVPGYLVLYKHNKVRYDILLTLGLLGGVLFSVLFAADSGPALVANAVMTTLAAGLFLYGLRRFS